MTSKLLRSLCAPALALLIPATSDGLTVPVAQDTCSAATGKIVAASGRGVALAVNSRQTALLRFDLNDAAVVPEAIQPGNIKSATLRLYAINVKPAGAVTVRPVTSDWQEQFAGPPAPLPSLTPNVAATIPAAELKPHTFVSVDVTAAVIAAVQAGSEFGFALQTTDPKARITFASKEGPATGYAAELEIEANTADDGSGNLTGASFTLSGTLSASTAFLVEPRPNNSPATANSNLFIGKSAGASNTSGDSNNFFGLSAGAANVDGYGNNFFGVSAGAANTAGYVNSFFGDHAGASNQIGAGNVFLGAQTGFLNVSGAANVYIGYAAGHEANAEYNVFIGTNSGATATGIRNVFVGAVSGGTATTGDENVFVGAGAGRTSQASGNTFVGYEAGAINTTGEHNVFLGFEAGSAVTTGSGNTFLGYGAGQSLTTETKNTLLGDSTSAAAGVTNSTAIGQGATVTVSNAVVLGSNCSVGIGSSAPNSTLQVNGSLSLPIRTSSAALENFSKSDYVLVVTTGGASVYLPSAAGISGRIYILKNRAGAGVTLLTSLGAQTIDGAASVSVAANATAHVISTGSQWVRID